MSITKKQLIGRALSEIGLGTYIFNASPDELQDALGRLEDLAAEWDGMGIRVGYSFGPDIDAETGIPDTSQRAFFTNLALDLAPTYGKTPSQATLMRAKNGFNALMVSRYTPIPQVQYPDNLPVGIGNGREVMDRAYFQPVDPLTSGDDIIEIA